MNLCKQWYKPLISFLIGAVYLSFFDWLQVKCGVEYYYNSTWSIVKVPLQFGILAIILDRLTGWFEKNFVERRFKATLFEVLDRLAIFAFLYLFTLLSKFAPSWSIALFFIVFTAFDLRCVYQKGDWKYMVALGLLGTILEGALVHLKTFGYTQSDLFGLPYWLPLLWANGGILVRRLFNLPWLRWRG
jgi:hypothetical protein